MSQGPPPDLSTVAPPQSLSAPLAALWWLKKGGLALGPEWQKAHALCQAKEGDRAHDLVHALCHWIEGDAANRDYWYRRAGAWQRQPAPAAEWQALWLDLNAGL